MSDPEKSSPCAPSGENEAQLFCVTAPNYEQYGRIRDWLADHFGVENLVLHVVENPSLGDGFKIKYGDIELDWSSEGRKRQLQEALSAPTQNASPETLVSIMKERVEEFFVAVQEKEVGAVRSVGDGIAVIDGIDHVEYGEIVLFGNGSKGMVQDIQEDSIGCILFSSETGIRQGTQVIRTGKTAGIPVGDDVLGRVLNALGEPIDGLGPFAATGWNPIESEAPGIMDRQAISVPMDTGLLVIDSMFPIGRGQRELIIGDRQTGKTAIALDTILNQKGKNVVCIYVAVGQKASTVSSVVSTLKRNGALEYSVVVSATASDPAPLQYIAPYSGCAIGEYFMRKGQDVLIVYDDLSKHAVAYRALSLLLGRSPGREAYPGDVFYLHSRLLERSARLSPELGGGSMTALPIIETQAGNVSAYIPTNVISITDGQIFLETDSFNAGQRPAVNVGLSVSRVGGDAQTDIMKKAAGSVRLDLAQYRELEVFTQFSSDLDDTTKAQLSHGAALMQLLKQPQYHPMSLHEQVLTLIAANAHVFSRTPAKEVKAMQGRLLAWFETFRPEIVQEIEEKKQMTEELRRQISDALDAFAASEAGGANG
ncbi:MAG TPA: F0F1 ATP synthase subunit alpha [Oscillospiraceae bacterium]|nr:F0F1 ATP synthase subunit alpha [Oscillospiraceae bacterium]HXK78229.1 F0F1 ATP synthase subunit alpha [Oscillospiraceae bacterium]